MQGREAALEPRSPTSRADAWARAVLAAAAVVRSPLLFSPLAPADSVIVSDGWRQTDTASIAHHFLVNGHKLFHPQIFWGGAGPGYVETEFQLYPFLVSLLYAVFGEHVWLGRLVSLGFTMVALAVFYRLARAQLGARPALWGLAFLSFSPLYLRYGLSFMPEPTVMCLYVVALSFFMRWVDEQQRRWLGGAALATALAILVKPTSIHLGLIFAVVALHRRGVGVLERWEVWAAGAVALLPALVWYWHARNLYLEYGNTFGILSGGDNKFGSLKTLVEPGFYLALARLEVLWVFAGVGLLVFTFGVVTALRRGRAALLVTGVAVNAIYFAIVARYARAEWGVHYHIYMLPFAALGVGEGVEAILERWREWRGVGAVAFAGAAVITVSGGLYRRLLGSAPHEMVSCGASVRELVPVESLVIVATTSVANDEGEPNNYQEPVIFFYSGRYGWSLPSDWRTQEHVERYRRSGAEFLVVMDDALVGAPAEFRGYLSRNARRVGAAAGSRCNVFRLVE